MTSSGGPAQARAAAELAARASYGRLLSIIAAPTGDIPAAEDALQAAFEQALRTWPDAGVPEHPDAWLLTVARNRQRDAWRAASTKDVALSDIVLGPRGAVVDPLEGIDPDAIGDKRLELLFVCAHPAIDAKVRAPLMLQTVLGFEASQVARAFAASPSAMAQRLVRAKRRIAQARVPFAVPPRADIAGRAEAVLEAVYGCAAITWRESGADSLAGEARYLARTLAVALEQVRAPAAAVREAWALAALVSFSLARRADDFVPLGEQDPATWDAALITEGEDSLRHAQGIAGAETPGRFELEAAIQAVHAARRHGAELDEEALRMLYLALLQVAPTAGARVAHAAVVGRIDGPDAGLALLSGEPETFQPLWAVRADLLVRAERPTEAMAAYERAAALSDDRSVRAHLLGRAAALRSD
ncbi:RNA polymerase sigma factor [Microbacterium sp. NPDC057650]|uniref:RNA polymerase sigma factor n=1 Tax=unclassified Microbacterium TaxID=2609290 RepID=UPI003670B802